MADSSVPLIAFPPPDESADLFRYFNVTNAKSFALLLFCVVAVYHSCIRLKYGDVSCVGLLEDGRYQGNHIWQPYGCMLHKYTPEDGRLCMKYMQYWGHKNWFVFIGDERMQQIHGRFSEELVPGTVLIPRGSAQSSLEYPALSLNTEYYESGRIDNSVLHLIAQMSRAKRWPKCIVISAPLVTLNDSSEMDSFLVDYQTNVSQLLLYMKDRPVNTTILWMLQPAVPYSQYNYTYSNQLIDQLNQVSQSLLSDSPSVKIWKSARLLSSGYSKDSVDGILLGDVALSYDSQILVNLYCNDVMNFDDGTCCSRPEAVRVRQVLAVFFCLAMCILAIVISFSSCKLPESSKSQILPIILDNGSPAVRTHRRSVSGTYNFRPHQNLSTIVCLGRLSLLLFFFYACDRANWLMKENKWFTLFNFLLPIVYLAVLGIFFNEESNKASFMHRDQTDEWKGWMVLVIMSYNMTGADKDIHLYMLYRCMISGLLFHLGYGHFMYFWTSGQFGLNRVFKTLFRYNLLAVLLCTLMGRPYQFYFFVPLASYWFVVLYITMIIPPTVSGLSIEQNGMHVFVMIAKFILLFSSLSVLFLSEVFFENVFVASPWKFLFVTADDGMQQWWFNWSIDRYTVPWGMVLAFSVCLLRRHLYLLDHLGHNLVSARLCFILVPISMAAIIGYGTFVFNCGAKSQCEQLHAYIFFCPILGYIVLRNLFGCLRTRVSGFFAWFGRISFELLVCQGHVWLAADWHGVLVLFPRWPVLNVIIVSFLFVCLAHELHACTLALSDRLFPDTEPAKVVRSVVSITSLLIITSLCSHLF